MSRIFSGGFEPCADTTGNAPKEQIENASNMLLMRANLFGDWINMTPLHEFALDPGFTISTDGRRDVINTNRILN